MSLENTTKESYLNDIKIESMNTENRSSQNDDDLDATWDLIKVEFNKECFSEVKVEDYSIDEKDIHLKKDKESFNIRDNVEHHGLSHVHEEETLRTHPSPHIRENTYSCNTYNNNFYQNIQHKSHL